MSVNESVDPPTITVGINGKTAQANLPKVGGNGWEKLDINDLPTDFSADDLIIFDLVGNVTTPTIPNWTTAPTEKPTITTNENYHLTVLVTGNRYDGFLLKSITFGSITNVTGVVILKGSFLGITTLNNKRGTAFQFVATWFNGGGATQTILNIEYNDLPSKVRAMYRYKMD